MTFGLTLGKTVVIPGWLALVILTALHLFEDEWRIWTIRKLSTPDTLSSFSYGSVYPLYADLRFFASMNRATLSLKMDTAGDNFCYGHAIFHLFSTYFVEKDVFGYAKLVPVEKYQSMIERLVTGLITAFTRDDCFRCPGPLAWPYFYSPEK